MAKLTAKQRKKIPASEFGLPKERKYPITDRGHAIAAKSRATQQLKEGNLTPAQKKKIDAKANAELKGKDKALEKKASTKNKAAPKKAVAKKSVAKKASPKKKDELVRGAAARKNKGFQQNIEVMEGAGYSKKRAIGAAYGEANSPSKPKAKAKSKVKVAAKSSAKAKPKAAAKKIAAKRSPRKK